MGGEGLCCARRRERDTSGSTPVSCEDLQNSTYALGGETHVKGHISEGHVSGWCVLTSFSTWNSQRKWFWPVHTSGRVTVAVCSTKSRRGGCSATENNTCYFIQTLCYTSEHHHNTIQFFGSANLSKAGNWVNIIYWKDIPELYHHCGSGIEAAQLFGGQVFKDSCLSKVVGIVGTSDGHLRERGDSQWWQESSAAHLSMCSADSNLKDELHPVRAGVIQRLNILWHIHVELGHAFFQVLIQLCNLNSHLDQMVGTLRSLQLQLINVCPHVSHIWTFEKKRPFSNSGA